MPARKAKSKAVTRITKKGTLTRAGKPVAKEVVRELFGLARSKPNPKGFLLSKGLNVKRLRAHNFGVEDFWQNLNMYRFGEEPRIKSAVDFGFSASDVLRAVYPRGIPTRFEQFGEYRKFVGYYGKLEMAKVLKKMNRDSRA
ncbi:MAG: hypothetical protein Q7S21_03065 [archaeon]|nr:hypothetical protein [archaeon]